jgi:beta-mannosidase
MALWCGNNELEQGHVGPAWTDRQMSWEDYGKLFDKLLPRLVEALHPGCDYWPGSPHTPYGDRSNFNDPTCGDAHLWDVWHGRKPFEWYRTCTHRFNSEFGFQSFPEPKTVNGYTTPADRNITSHVMEHHQRSGIGNTVIMQYMLDWFRLPGEFDMVLWASQILHGMAMKYAVEHWRRSMPRGMGTLYWQINDTWPVASWASIDYHGRWKALHYMARHFNEPVLVSAVEDIDAGTVELHVTNDLPAPFAGKIHWLLTDLDGNVVAKGDVEAAVGERKSRKAATLNLRAAIEKTGKRNAIFWCSLHEGRNLVSRNLATFARPKHLELGDPKLAVSIKRNRDGGFRVTVSARKPALWTWLELSEEDATFSDNFFHVRPGASVDVDVIPNRNMTVAEFKDQLSVRSIRDTYQA